MGIALYSFSRFILRRLAAAFNGLEVRGQGNAPREGPLIVAANHTSYLDPIVLGTALDRPLSFMARRTLFANAVFGWYIRNHFAFPIDREGDIREAMRLFAANLSQGRAVVMFPEGTRSATGKIASLKPGVGLIAVKNQAPILPVYVWGSYHAWPRHRRFPRPHRMKVIIGRLITPAPPGAEVNRKAEQNRIAEEVWRQLLALEVEAWQGEE